VVLTAWVSAATRVLAAGQGPDLVGNLQAAQACGNCVWPWIWRVEPGLGGFNQTRVSSIVDLGLPECLSVVHVHARLVCFSPKNRADKSQTEAHCS
jgi:hypothetical protein